MAEPITIRILTIDPLLLVHAGVRQLLAAFPDLQLVGEAFDLHDALRLGPARAATVALVEIDALGPEWPAALRRLLEALCIPLVVFTLEADAERVREALRAGARGYLLKNTRPLALAQALRSIAAGQQVFAPEVLGITFSAQSRDLGVETLTRREREVLALLAHGLSNDEIGARLCVSRATVKFHCGQIFAKLGVQSRSQAVAVAYARNLAPRLIAETEPVAQRPLRGTARARSA
ncbi:MAG: response regulator transcription factor [Oscillochloridaceae bacterium]|nr:response regulator transcription factor [Chloroflexaceae bacterium]MDW8389076.1 response regulator transcription factor [Oscillochloridaceae bacterium]